jgi:hypothetical protein
MEAVRILVESESPQSYTLAKALKERKQAWCIGSFIAVYSVQAVLIYYLIISHKDYAIEHRHLILPITYVGRTFNLALDIWMFTLFIRLLYFYVQKKSEKANLTLENKLVIGWTAVNFFLKAMNAFFVFSVLTLFQYI